MAQRDNSSVKFLRHCLIFLNPVRPRGRRALLFAAGLLPKRLDYLHRSMRFSITNQRLSSFIPHIHARAARPDEDRYKSTR